MAGFHSDLGVLVCVSIVFFSFSSGENLSHFVFFLGGRSFLLSVSFSDGWFFLFVVLLVSSGCSCPCWSCPWSCWSVVSLAGFTLDIFFRWSLASVFWSVFRRLFPSVIFGGEWPHDTCNDFYLTADFYWPPQPQPYIDQTLDTWLLKYHSTHHPIIAP